MSAVRLEKKLASFEQKLRRQMEDELRSSLSPVLARLAALEAKLGAVLVESQLGDSSVSVDMELHGDVEKTAQDHPPSSAQEVVAQRSTADTPSKEGGEPLAATEPVPYMDSAWNLTIVLGSSEAGWLDQALACMLLVLSIGMQLCFIAIVGGPSFQDSDFANKLASAEQWRWSSAHDYRNMDFGEVSLASRVCAGDGSLIISTDERNVLQEINNYLHMRPGDLSSAGFQPGVVLCLLCILLWFLYVCNGFRESCLSLEAVSCIPRGRRSVFQNGSLEVVSWPRFFAFLTSRLLQMGFSAYLLYSGMLWLAGTTSIQDLILNAVALGAILDIDQMIFSAMMPKSVQATIQGLEAIKVKFSRRRSQGETVCILLCTTSVVVLSYVYLVQPLATDMESLKYAYCAGNQDFVVFANPDTQVIGARSTEKYRQGKELSLSELAVQDFVFVDEEGQAKYLFHADPALFDQLRTSTMETMAESDISCEDFDNISLDIQAAYGAYFNSAALSLGVPEASKCADLRHLCSSRTARALRHLCGVSCGCNDPLASIWYRSSMHGCTRGCQMKAAEVAAAQPCRDRSEDSAAWFQIWEEYPLFMSDITGIDLVSHPHRGLAGIVTAFAAHMKQEGCAGLLRYPTDPITKSPWCEASKYNAPLAYHCPHSCGCNASSQVDG